MLSVEPLSVKRALRGEKKTLGELQDVLKNNPDGNGILKFLH